ncbi:GMP synthase [Petrotoga sp. HWH.PT.55.6.1]|uniref:glutamine-hydrolyzing GMP synthase n=1 Tax=unclassified Petrotoga TaxID=2620614 RepID=UPI000CA05D20|nr:MULTISPECIES: glutamine-hydrolyzing GMP synthase [unclassified Petrotoga]PNR93758.1 GMP synthase [Petrotoga sp. HWHPT.55.6.3]RPD36483.1 GMP synthase [Petrotoga sp. HWH.PT.55.6.1]
MEKILVIDYGSQYTQLLAKRIRDLGVFSEVIQYDDNISLSNVKGIILSGGPDSVYDIDAPDISDEILNAELPILGICYGMQLIAKKLGGKVEQRGIAEYGKTKINITDQSLLFKKIPSTFNVWMSHKDMVTKVPEKFKITSLTSNNIISSFENESENIYCIQFHPEVRHTEFGADILKNFIHGICGLKGSWTLMDFVENKIKEIRDTIGDKKAIIALSGGVDSSVAAVLTHKAIGNNLKAIFVNHGLLRMNEVEEVESTFRDYMGLNLTTVDAQERFLSKLKRVTDPEQKRKIIGEEFIRVFEQEAKKEKDCEYLIQGTIYSDVIESAKSGKKTFKIKSHHNVGGLPEDIDLKIVEPLKELFKDEVRSVGEILGLPREILYRHPFPGPGLAIRIIGEINEEKLTILKKVDSIFIKTLKETGWYDKVWQAFAVLIPVKTVGITGDKRSYGYVAALRSVDSVEGMTADWSKIPFEILDLVSSRITNEVEAITRVVYDISSKPPATIEWE